LLKASSLLHCVGSSASGVLGSAGSVLGRASRILDGVGGTRGSAGSRGGSASGVGSGSGRCFSRCRRSSGRFSGGSGSRSFFFFTAGNQGSGSDNGSQNERLIHLKNSLNGEKQLPEIVSAVKHCIDRGKALELFHLWPQL
jgi:hypothetical protein